MIDYRYNIDIWPSIDNRYRFLEGDTYRRPILIWYRDCGTEITGKICRSGGTWGRRCSSNIAQRVSSHIGAKTKALTIHITQSFTATPFLINHKKRLVKHSISLICWWLKSSGMARSPCIRKFVIPSRNIGELDEFIALYIIHSEEHSTYMLHKNVLQK